MVNPCCCMPLQRGVSVLAIIDAILNIIALVFFGLALAGVIAIDPDKHPDISHNHKIQAIVAIVIGILGCVFQITLALYLRSSAKTKNDRGCLIWLIVTGILVVLSIISRGLQYDATVNIWGVVIGALIGVLYKLYEMWVVISFRTEVLRERNNIQFG